MTAPPDRPPLYPCRRAPHPFAIDGDLGKEIWRSAPEVELVRAVDGAAPRQRTGVRLLWDVEHLYAAFRVEDGEIVATHTERDAPLWEEEVVELFLDPWGAERLYVEIEVSPRNVVFDALVINRARDGETRRDLEALTAWDCRGLRTAVRVDGVVNGGAVSRGWDVELAIPLRELAPRRPPTPGEEWRFNAYRIDRSASRGDELQALSPIGRPDFHVPERFARLRLRLTGLTTLTTLTCATTHQEPSMRTNPSRDSGPASAASVDRRALVTAALSAGAAGLIGSLPARAAAARADHEKGGAITGSTT